MNTKRSPISRTILLWVLQLIAFSIKAADTQEPRYHNSPAYVVNNTNKNLAIRLPYRDSPITTTIKGTLYVRVAANSWAQFQTQHNEAYCYHSLDYLLNPAADLDLSTASGWQNLPWRQDSDNAAIVALFNNANKTDKIMSQALKSEAHGMIQMIENKHSINGCITTYPEIVMSRQFTVYDNPATPEAGLYWNSVIYKDLKVLFRD
ncbi:MAG: hypothetical protein WCE21_01970 [Candidatus Babeliales bacterium]